MKILSLVAALFLSVPFVAQAQEAQSAPPPSVQEPADTVPDYSGFFNEPNIIAKAIRYGNRLAGSGDGGEVKNGFYPELGDMVTGAGWISGGPGYRYWLFDDRMFVDASAALSWRMFKMAQARVEMPKLARSRLTLGVQGRWHDYTQITYFGSGPDSLETDRSEYRIENANVVGYAVVQPLEWMAINGKFGFLSRPSIQEPSGTFDRGYPYIATMFADDPGVALERQPNFLHGEVGFVADTRDHRGYPAEGGLYQATWTRYSDRGVDRFSFDRLELEGAHFIPVGTPRIVFAAHGWLAATRADDGESVPFYLQPTLGGSNSLRSFQSYRFHDRNLLLVNAEVRVRIFEHVDWAAFTDAGNVAATVGDLNLDRRSYGIGLRLHTVRATIARLDVAHGGEGWRVLFRVNDPFRFTRVTRRTAAIPFVP